MDRELPTTQTAAVIYNPGPMAKLIIRTDIPVRSHNDDEVIVKLEFSGICGSELRAFRGWSPYDRIVGHEGVGVVVKTGKYVDENWMGRRVGVKWLFGACERCSVCLDGYPNHCPKQVNTGRHVPGTLQQYVSAKAKYLTRIPDNLTGHIAAPLLCAGLTMAGAIASLEKYVSRGKWIVISGGGGGLGHIGIQLASNHSGYRIISVDSGSHKKQLSIQSGAEHFVDFANENVEETIQQLTGGGAHAVVVVSGSEEAFRIAPQLVRNRGVIICVGLPENGFQLPISTSLCSARGLTITGVAVGTEEQVEALLDMAAKGQIKPHVEVADFSELPVIFNQLEIGVVKGRKVVRIPE